METDKMGKTAKTEAETATTTTTEAETVAEATTEAETPDPAGPAATPDVPGADNPPTEDAATAEAVADAPPLDIGNLRYCAQLIADLNTTGHRLALLDELRDKYGLTGEVEQQDGFAICMQGITIEPAPYLELALDNWANAARRAIIRSPGA
jgi:hypothetical protein